MTEKRQYNVALNAKGLEAFVSEEQARRMVSTPGATSLFIVEAHHGPYLTNEDGSIKMNLIMDTVELVPEQHAERVRVVKRALYLARPDQYGQEAFEQATEGEVPLDSALAAVDAIVERDNDGEPVGVWDGDPDTADPDTKSQSDAEDTTACPFPGCILPEHEGEDHVLNPDATEGTTEGAAQFSNA